MQKLLIAMVAVLALGNMAKAQESDLALEGDYIADVADMEMDTDMMVADNGAPGDRDVADDKSAPSDEGGKHKGKHHGFGPCGKVNLDDSQKAKIKEAMFKFQENKIDLVAQVKKAKLNYRKVVGDQSSDYKAGKNAANAVNEAVEKLMTAKSNLKTQIAFQILKPEQREPAQMCQMMMKHHHGGRNHWAKRGDKHNKKFVQKSSHTTESIDG